MPDRKKKTEARTESVPEVATPAVAVAAMGNEEMAVSVEVMLRSVGWGLYAARLRDALDKTVNCIRRKVDAEGKRIGEADVDGLRAAADNLEYLLGLPQAMIADYRAKPQVEDEDDPY